MHVSDQIDVFFHELCKLGKRTKPLKEVRSHGEDNFGRVGRFPNNRNPGGDELLAKRLLSLRKDFLKLIDKQKPLVC